MRGGRLPCTPAALHTCLRVLQLGWQGWHLVSTPTPPPLAPRLLDRVEVEVGDGWLQHMRLATAEPGRAARLLAGASAARDAAPSGSGLLLEGQTAAAAK